MTPTRLLAISLSALFLASGCAATSDTDATTSCKVSSAIYESSAAVSISGSALPVPGDELAMGFKAATSFSASSIQLRLIRVGFPTGTINLNIEADSGGGTGPSGTALATSSMSVVSDQTSDTSNVETTATLYPFTFSAAVSFEKDSIYWVRVGATWARQDLNVVKWSASNTDSFAAGNAVGESGTPNMWNTSLLGLTRDMVIRMGCE